MLLLILLWNAKCLPFLSKGKPFFVVHIHPFVPTETFQTKMSLIRPTSRVPVHSRDDKVKKGIEAKSMVDINMETNALIYLDRTPPLLRLRRIWVHLNLALPGLLVCSVWALCRARHETRRKEGDKSWIVDSNLHAGRHQRCSALGTRLGHGVQVRARTHARKESEKVGAARKRPISLSATRDDLQVYV